MKHLITTYCDRNKGDFLVHHWLRSLKAHTNLDQIDIMVIDFGLTEEQVQLLEQEQVIVNRQEQMNGRMSNFQYKYLGDYLRYHDHYDQVLYCDCGDLIFQSDISHLFRIRPNSMKLVLEQDFNVHLHRMTLGFDDVRKEKLPELKRMIGNKPTANCGFVLGPAHKVRTIWQEYISHCHAAELHGTDQLIINYMIYRDGFEILDEQYNYVTFLKKDRLAVDEQGFYTRRGKVIPIVHNAGRYDFARTITNFGYRQGTIKPLIYRRIFRLYYKMLNMIAHVV